MSTAHEIMSNLVSSDERTIQSNQANNNGT